MFDRSCRVCFSTRLVRDGVLKHNLLDVEQHFPKGAVGKAGEGIK
jgi:hypothetical protein